METPPRRTPKRRLEQICWAPSRKAIRPCPSPTEDPPAINLFPAVATSAATSALKALSDSQDSEEEDDPAIHYPLPIRHDMEEQIIPESDTLVVRNLPRNLTTTELNLLFVPFGTLLHTYLPIDMEHWSNFYGQNKGYAFLTFQHHDDAVKAFRTLYRNLHIQGRFIDLEFMM